MVHALCALNEVTVKRPTRCEGVADLPSLLRSGDYLLSADTEEAFWHVPIHSASRKFFSSHFAMPAYYAVNGHQEKVLCFNMHVTDANMHVPAPRMHVTAPNMRLPISTWWQF